MKVTIELEWHPVEDELPKGYAENLYVTARDNETKELVLWEGVAYDDRKRANYKFYWVYNFRVVPLEPEYTVLAWANKPNFPLYKPKEDADEKENG